MLRNIVLLLIVVNISAKVQSLEIPHVDHVIRSLSSQQWDEDEVLCRSKIFHLLENVKNSTLWAEWVWNAIPQSPTGLFYGTRFFFGNYDQCLRPTWLTTTPELRTQYCLADVELAKSGVKTNHLPDPYARSEEYYLNFTDNNGRSFSYMAYGVCLPAGCPTKSVEKFVRALLNTGHLQAANPEVSIHHCEKAGAAQVYSRGFYRYLYTFAALFFVAVASTYYRSKFPATANKNTFVNHVAKSFCLPHNWAKVFEADKGTLTCLYGIRFLTSVFIVVFHQTSFHYQVSVSRAQHESLPKLQLFKALISSNLHVETFFAVSGLLLGRTLSTLDVTKPYNLLKIISKRYMRLVGPLAVGVFYTAYVLVYVDNGPIFLRIAKVDQKACEQNWWLTMLMVGNYFNTENMCFPVSWYVHCDFQLHAITLMLLYVYRKHPSAGKAATAVVLVLGFVAPGVTTYVYDMPAITSEDVRANNARELNSFTKRHIPTHNRISSYAAGLLVGYLMSVHKPADYKKVWSKKKSLLGAMTSFAVMIGVLSLGIVCHIYRINGIMACIFQIFNKTTFALAVLGIIVFCTYGDVPLINSFLSWSAFVPLSRFSYGIYIFHEPLLFRNKFSFRDHLEFHELDTPISVQLTELLGILMLCLMLSMAVWLLVEAPLINFSNRYLNTKLESKEKTVETKNDANGARLEDELEKQKAT